MERFFHLWNRQTAFAIALIAMVGAALCLYTRNNAFPHIYHVDEERKVHQIQMDYRNCWHPLLLLTATDVALGLRGKISPSPTEIVVAGRWCSALFAVGAAMALALLANAAGGRLAGLATFALVASHPLLYEAAHFMKEDTSLLVGITLSLLAGHRLMRLPNAASASLLGIANALAVSGKYAGVVMIAPALCLLTLSRLGLKPWACYGLGLVGAVALINHDAIAAMGAVTQGVGREWTLMVSGHHGAAREVPHSDYFWAFWRMMSLPVILLALVHGARQVWLRSFRDAIPGIFAIAYLMLLSFFPKTADRYLLPVVAVTGFYAAMGALDVARWISTRSILLRLSIGATALVALALGAQGLLFSRYMTDFSSDSRADLARWIIKSLPPQTQIASGIWVQLAGVPHPGFERADISEYPDYAADYGTLRDLIQRGVQYVAVARPESQPFLESGIFPTEKTAPDFFRRREFYRDLESSATEVWTAPERLVKSLHPGIRLFKLADPPSPLVTAIGG